MNKLLQRKSGKHVGKKSRLGGVVKKKSNPVANKPAPRKNTRELKKAHDQLKTLFENIDKVLYSIDIRSYKLLQVSAACEKVYGYTIQEFFDDTDLWQKVIHPDDKQSSQRGADQLYHGNGVLSQYRIIHKDKSIRWIENKIIPTLNKKGKLVRIDGIVSDITQRKQAEKDLEESVSILESIIESTADGILVLDAEGKISRFNNKFLELWQISRHVVESGNDKEALAHVLNQLKRPEEFISRLNEIYGDPNTVSLDTIEFKDGRLFERYTQPQLVKGGYAGRVISFRDITASKKAEEELSNNEVRFRTLTSNAPVGIFQTDHEGKLIYVNNTWLGFTGMTIEEALGDGWVAAIHPDDREQLINDRHNESKIKTRFSIEFRFIDKEGTIRWISGEAIPLFNNAGEFTGVIGTLSDITERKKAETKVRTNERQLSIAAHIAKLGYWEFDVDNGLFTFNDQFYSIFKTTVEKVGSYILTPQRYAELFVHPEDAPLVGKEVADAINSTDPHFNHQVEHRIIYATGEVGYISVHFYVVKNNEGRTIKTFGVNQDITDQKKEEEKLLKSEIILEAKNKELELKNKELEQFAYVASHDLQEPLRTTSTFAELLHQQYKDKLDEKADKYLTFITQSSERMKVLIKDLLDYSRIGKKTQYDRIDCNTTLSEVLADLDIAIQEAGAIIKADPLPIINGYPTEIKQLFQNLIINAVKFRKKDSSPEIKISVQKRNDEWEFVVADNGIGIEAEHKERIFIIFQRLHSRNEYSGSGIGLAHCKKIAELHGGKIWVVSNQNEGSSFYFTIPTA